jgi:uncharacterized protein (TIGR01244 family)
MKHAMLLFAMTAGLGWGCAATPKAAEKPPPPRLVPWDEFREAPEGRVWLGAQPSEQALDAFSAHGRGLVVNLRTDEEMAYLPFYADAVSARGLRYVRIPTRGADLDAGEVEALADAMRAHPGPVMLHCASGGRASVLWAMHRMSAEGLSAEEAAAWLEGERGEVSEETRQRLAAFGATRSHE